MWLIVDDERVLGCDIVVRNAAVARVVLTLMYGKIEGVCFDHDLGPGETGYDVLCWAIQGGTIPRLVQLVTANPVGRKQMQQALVQAGYKPDPEVAFRYWRAEQPEKARTT